MVLLNLSQLDYFVTWNNARTHTHTHILKTAIINYDLLPRFSLYIYCINNNTTILFIV